MSADLVTTAHTRRAATPEDREFLLDLYATTRTAELDLLSWTSAERAAFVQMQYDAQGAAYGQQSVEGRVDVVEVAGRPAGRLYLDHRPTDVRIVDIALLPEQRGQGIGSALLREVVSEAAASGRTVSLHVERGNPARALYRRLGFVELEDDGLRLLMEWRAA
jgi:ribosomal protein S18 acetylase RimI-like enzyme